MIGGGKTAYKALELTNLCGFFLVNRKMNIRAEYLFQCTIKVVPKCQLAPSKLNKMQHQPIIDEIVAFH